VFWGVLVVSSAFVSGIDLILKWVLLLEVMYQLNNFSTLFTSTVAVLFHSSVQALSDTHVLNRYTEGLCSIERMNGNDHLAPKKRSWMVDLFRSARESGKKSMRLLPASKPSAGLG